MQVANPPPSIRHSKVPASFELKVKSAEVEAVGLSGALSIKVSGAVVSIVQVWISGVGSTFNAASIACTVKVCEPSASPG